MIAREGAALRRTARRYSLCAEDADDAYQRAMEIVLTKAPTDNPRELIRWTQVVTKHEALAIRKQRERMLGAQPTGGDPETEQDWVALIPAPGDGPEDRVEKHERIARSREALRALKPAERRALTLLAEGYSYAEISEITGFSRTKVNRCLAEGRERFRRLVSGSEDGSRCQEMLPLLSAFCDEEASVDEEAVREHLRACGGCRATLREYRGATGAAGALAPTLPGSRSIVDRLHDLIDAIQGRFSGGGAESAATQMASGSGAAGAGAAGASGAGITALGGTGGAGLTTAAKILAVCAGTAGAATACVATGVVPAPADPLPRSTKAATVERVAATAFDDSEAIVAQEDNSQAEAPVSEPARRPDPVPEPRGSSPPPASIEAAEPPPAPVEAGAVEYSPPPPAPAPAPPPPVSSTAGSGSAAGEFGP